MTSRRTFAHIFHLAMPILFALMFALYIIGTHVGTYIDVY